MPPTGNGDAESKLGDAIWEFYCKTSNEDEDAEFTDLLKAFLDEGKLEFAMELLRLKQLDGIIAAINFLAEILGFTITFDSDQLQKIIEAIKGKGKELAG